MHPPIPSTQIRDIAETLTMRAIDQLALSRVVRRNFELAIWDHSSVRMRHELTSNRVVPKSRMLIRIVKDLLYPMG